MFEPTLAAVRAAVDGVRAWSTVAELARHHRIQATSGYDEAAAWVRARLSGLGLRIEVDDAPADGRTRHLGWLSPEGWGCRDARAWLETAAGREEIADFAREPLSIVQRSASLHGRFPLAAVPDGAEADPRPRPELRGHVVLTRGPAMRAHERWVLGEGAAAIACDGRRLLPPVRTEYTDPDALAYTSYWWAEDTPRGAGLVLTPRRGADCRQRLAAGEAITMEIAIEATRQAAHMPLVSAVLAGEWPGEILLTAHLCHPRPGANDNGSGVAAGIEAIEALATLAARGALPRERRSIRVLFVPELTGTAAWLARDPRRAACTQAVLNLDMVGERQDRCGSTFLLEHPPHFLGSFAEEWLRLVRHAAQEWVSGYSGPGHYSLVRMAEVPYSGGSDHMLWIDPAHGVPCPMLIQWPDRFYHSSYDTPDEVDPASLAHAARTAATYAAFLAAAGPAELEWLTALVGRGARRRLLAVLDGRGGREAAEAEHIRGQAALASLARLAPAGGGGGSGAPLALAVEELEGFYEAEVAPRLPPVAHEPGRDIRVPRRRIAAPLELLRHLLPGWERADPALHREWRALEAGLAAPNTVLDVAWYACDGRRSVADVLAAVRREGWDVEESALTTFFELATRLGLAELEG